MSDNSNVELPPPSNAPQTAPQVVVQPSQFPPPKATSAPVPNAVAKSDSDRIAALEKDLADLKSRLARKIAFL